MESSTLKKRMKSRAGIYLKLYSKYSGFRFRFQVFGILVLEKGPVGSKYIGWIFERNNAGEVKENQSIQYLLKALSMFYSDRLASAVSLISPPFAMTLRPRPRLGSSDSDLLNPLSPARLVSSPPPPISEAESVFCSNHPSPLRLRNPQISRARSVPSVDSDSAYNSLEQTEDAPTTVPPFRQLR